MIKSFQQQTKELFESISELVNSGEMFKSKRDGEKFNPEIPQELQEEFFKVIDKVNLSLMEDQDNFYGYFLFQMLREIRFDISSPTGVSFKGAKYVIYFNPLIFLQLNIKQMESTIKHEVHHILSLHLLRAKELKNKYSTLAINLAMDIVVNQYLTNLPPYATTLEWVNMNYSLNLEPYNTFEYYVDKIQTELDLLEESDEGEEDDTRESEEDLESLSQIEQNENDNREKNQDIQTEYDPEKTHEMWEEQDELDEKTLQEFTEKFISNSAKGKIPIYIESMIAALKNSKGEMPWNLYLKKLMGTIGSNKKKTVTRRNRRQPNRLDLRGELRNHKAEIAVAIDVSGSISDEEFKQAIKEVLSIVKNYNHEITVIECDKEIRRTYKAKSIKDIKERVATGGGTKFSPVIEYANSKNINLLVYFTDGKGENRLEVIPRGYKVLWIISGRGDKLSLVHAYGAIKNLSKVKVNEKIPDMRDVRNDGYSMNNQEPTLDI